MSLWTNNGEIASRIIILKLLCLQPDKVCKCSGVYCNFLHQSMKSAELLAPRNPHLFRFVSFFPFLHRQFVAAQAVLRAKLHIFLTAAVTVSHCRKQTRMRLLWPSPYDITHASLPTRLFRHYVFHALVRVIRTKHSYVYHPALLFYGLKQSSRRKYVIVVVFNE